MRARADEREGGVQVGAVGIAILGERTGRRPTSHRSIDRARKGSGLGRIDVRCSHTDELTNSLNGGCEPP
jgi:hypothetical protein